MSYKEKKSRHSDPEAKPKQFTFLDHQNALNNIIAYGKDHLIKDLKDFWLFVKKYEALVLKTGQALIDKSRLDDDYKKYNKRYTMNIKIKNCDSLYDRIPIDFTKHKPVISVLEFKHFMDIVVYYLDFKQKEKFSKVIRIKECKASLPISQYKTDILKAVDEKRVVIIAGDTGCGKSTQVPQYLYEHGYRNIACTQPRRIACISLSKRVAYEMLNEFGTTVGYEIRFEKNKHKSTEISFITEGLLLRQMSTPENVGKFQVIVLDEVHERHLHGDFLLGVVKCLIQTCNIKIILMSATINIDLFSTYFSNEQALVIQVPGRLFPISVHYKPILVDTSSKSSKMDAEPYVQIMQLIDLTYDKNEKGDLLIFVSGINEISTVVDAANTYNEQNGSWIILPLHSTLSLKEQDKVFDYAPQGLRKCIVSTNIAETSVTIDGIRFVIDSGKVKEMTYDAVFKMQRLKEVWISKASAQQRMGRAGRTGPGVCYRLYMQSQYDDMDEYTTPELQKVPLDSLILQMLSMGLKDARQFPFIESPAPKAIDDALLSLKHHAALTDNEVLTSIGKALAQIPVDIIIGKMLISGSVFHQVEAVLSAAAALSIQNPFTNRAYRDLECERARKDLESDHGDPVTLLNAYRAWLEVKYETKQDSRRWCWKRGFEEQRFYELTKLRNQFKDLLRDNTDDDKVSTIRKGELKQLKRIKRKVKESEVKTKRKYLKLDETDDEDTSIDIRDIDFRISNDANKLILSSTACTYKDLTMFKLIICSGLYPQVAIADEFNYCKSPMEQLFHTRNKPYTSLHPMSFFGCHPQVLQLQEQDIISSGEFVGYKSRLSISSKHQLVCYLTLLETTKPYLTNTMRMPAAQTLLLFAHSIDTNSTFSRLVCDQWLQLDFPGADSGLTLLCKALKVRKQWDLLLHDHLQQRKDDELEYEVTQNLLSYMNTEVPYTIKRLLQIDSKTIYNHRTFQDFALVDPNPIDDTFICTPNENKGGVYLTPNLTYDCLEECEWSLIMANQDWCCPTCDLICPMTGLQKLVHKFKCGCNDKSKSPAIKDNIKSGDKKYDCDCCNKTLYFKSNVDILRHKKVCIKT